MRSSCIRAAMRAHEVRLVTNSLIGGLLALCGVYQGLEDVASIGRADLRLDRATVSIVEIVRVACALSRLETVGRHIVFEVVPDFDPLGVWDAGRLATVLVELLHNAV